jgi:hypothetical protein
MLLTALWINDWVTRHNHPLGSYIVQQLYVLTIWRAVLPHQKGNWTASGDGELIQSVQKGKAVQVRAMKEYKQVEKR